MPNPFNFDEYRTSLKIEEALKCTVELNIPHSEAPRESKTTFTSWLTISMCYCTFCRPFHNSKYFECSRMNFCYQEFIWVILPRYWRRLGRMVFMVEMQPDVRRRWICYQDEDVYQSSTNIWREKLQGQSDRILARSGAALSWAWFNIYHRLYRYAQTSNWVIAAIAN